MSRLAQLLRQFQLPPGASGAQLRQAYFRQAKKLHPDRNPHGQATQEFAQLRADFEEALQLLEQQKTMKSNFGADAAFTDSGPNVYGVYGEPGLGENQRWSAAAWAARSQEPRSFTFQRSMSSSWSSPPRQSPRGVPVEGLPQDMVYTIAGALSAGFFLLGIWKFLTSESIGVRHRLGPEWLRPDGLHHFSREAGDASRPRKLRSALEGSKDSKDQSPPDFVAPPMAAHHAAALDRVWWLERCGATPGCRPLLSSKDERGDTPLHHCARTGHSEACCALLRHNVEQTVNHFGLAPQQLAQQLGHKDIAVLLRSWTAIATDPTAVAARRRVARHPDGLGHLAVPEDGVDFDFDAKECLKQAVKMAGFDIEVPSEEHSKWVESLFELRTTLEIEAGEGLLVYERPGQVTADAKGHWYALRRGKEHFYRLDPVRGCFALTASEAAELLQRYRAYGFGEKLLEWGWEQATPCWPGLIFMA